MLKNLPENYRKVLLQIAKEGPQTKYEIEKRTKVNHASVNEAVRYFFEKGEIVGYKAGKTRTGQTKIKYELSWLGLWRVIAVVDPKDCDIVFPKLKSFLPLIFGKWFYFKKHKLSKELVKALRWLSQQFDYWGIGEIWLRDWPKYMLGKLPKELLFDFEKWVMDRFGDYVFMLQHREFKVQWLKAFREDSELKKWAIKRIKLLIYEGCWLLKHHKESLEALKIKHEPDWSKMFHAPRSLFPSDEELSRFFDQLGL